MQIYPLFFMRFFIIFKKEKYWHYNDSMRPIINFIIDNRPIVYRYMLKVLKHIPINILKTFFFRISKIFLMSALSSVSILILISPETESLTLKQPWRLSFVWVLLLSRMLLKFNDFSIATPSASAFVQARSKIKPEAFKALFNGFWYYVKKKCHWTSMHCMPKKENWYSRKSMHVCLCIISVKGLFRK